MANEDLREKAWSLAVIFNQSVGDLAHYIEAALLAEREAGDRRSAAMRETCAETARLYARSQTGAILWDRGYNAACQQLAAVLLEAPLPDAGPDPYEACAGWCEAIGKDWNADGQHVKAAAADYLANWLRTIRANSPTPRAPEKGRAEG